MWVGHIVIQGVKIMVMKKKNKKNKKWIQGVAASIKRRKTTGKCTGKNFGGPKCPPGSKQYILAQTFRKMARNLKRK